LGKPQFGAIEIEAIQEVGNIVINSVGGAFGNVIGLTVEFDVPTVSFLEYPLPSNLNLRSNRNYYSIASTMLMAKDIDMEGYLNLTFAYNNIEIFERFVREGNILSRKFGELLLADGVITQEQLETALRLQKDSRRFIGELMVDRGYITEAQREEILNGQKYTRFSRKFGELVLEKNLITPKQLEELLTLQKHAKSFIGEILVHIGFMNDKTKDEVLERFHKEKGHFDGNDERGFSAGPK